MTSLLWEASYSVDVEPMDNQHKKIFDHMAAICKALADNRKIEFINEMLDRFDIYCKMHFFDEERLMENMNFPSISGHKRQHDLFVQNLDMFRSSDLQHPVQTVSDEFMNIEEWFVNHILTEDMSYSEFYLCKHKI